MRGEDIILALLKDHPYRAYARTTSQRLLSLPTEKWYTHPDRPDEQADAYGGEHLLVTHRAYAAYPQPAETPYVIVAEIRYARRGDDPNAVWVLALPVGSAAQPIAARYAGKKIELWLDEPLQRAHSFVKYVAEWDKPGTPFHRGETVRISQFPKLSNQVIVFNTWDPAKNNFIYGGPDGLCLASVDGRTLKQMDYAEMPRDHDPVSQALWDWRVPEKDVPQGKAAWSPLSHSTNGKYWLVENKRTHSVYRLSLP